MRTNLEFRPSELNDPGSDVDRPGGEKVARLLGDQLAEHGFSVTNVFAEDWGWCVAIENDAFPLWIGCGDYAELAHGHLCFIQPNSPTVRRWLRRVSTVEIVDRLADAIEAVIRGHDGTYDLRWWTEVENARG